MRSPGPYTIRREPVAYFLTFRTYGSWLPGDQRGTAGRKNNVYGRPLAPPSFPTEEAARGRMSSEPFALDAAARSIVEKAARATAEHRRWRLHAVNARTEHVHVVLTARGDPARVLGALKAWATRSLVEAGLVERGRRLWSRHGSTKYIWDQDGLAQVYDYVTNMQ
jgi:REP element-mobilizing transposase RayT